MEPIRMVFSGVPIAKGRPRFSFKGGHAYTPQKTRIAERKIRFEAQALWNKPPLTIPLSLVATFYLPRPKRPRFPFPAVRPDTDNFLKLLIDSLNGVLWSDDALLVDIRATKLYALEQPGTVVIITPYETAIPL